MTSGIVGLRGHPGGGGAGGAEAVGPDDAFPVEISSTSLLTDFDSLQENQVEIFPPGKSRLCHAVRRDPVTPSFSLHLADSCWSEMISLIVARQPTSS